MPVLFLSVLLCKPLRVFNVGVGSISLAQNVESDYVPNETWKTGSEIEWSSDKFKSILLR